MRFSELVLGSVAGMFVPLIAAPTVIMPTVRTVLPAAKGAPSIWFVK
jgi:hypothetical protein